MGPVLEALRDPALVARLDDVVLAVLGRPAGPDKRVPHPVAFELCQGLRDLGLLEGVEGLLRDVNGSHSQSRIESLDQSVFQLPFMIEADHFLRHLTHAIHFQCEHGHRTVSVSSCHVSSCSVR